MENREVAIRLSGVKKMYKLGQIGGSTLQGDLQSWWARVRGKEDPNTMIGTPFLLPSGVALVSSPKSLLCSTYPIRFPTI